MNNCPQCLSSENKMLKHRCAPCEQTNKTIRTAVEMFGPNACLTREDLLPIMAHAYSCTGIMPRKTREVFQIVLDEPNAVEILSSYTAPRDLTVCYAWLKPYLAYAYLPAMRLTKASFLKTLPRNSTVCSICWCSLENASGSECDICNHYLQGLRTKNPAFVMRAIKRFAAAPGILPEDIVDLLLGYQALVDVHEHRLTLLRRDTINRARRKLRDSHALPLTRIESDLLLEVSKCQKHY